jgi:hypothetical protein
VGTEYSTREEALAYGPFGAYEGRGGNGKALAPEPVTTYANAAQEL